MGKEAKTNAMRMLDRKKVKYEAIAYDCGEFIDGIHCADITGAPHDQSFKTLVMEGKSGGVYGNCKVCHGVMEADRLLYQAKRQKNCVVYPVSRDTYSVKILHLAIFHDAGDVA